MTRPSSRTKNRTRPTPEVLVSLARGHGTLRSQIEAALREAARSGRLRPGSLLPSSRVLARDLGVSRGVIVGAYEQLTAEGFLFTRPRGRTVVAPRARRAERRESTGVSEVLQYDFRPGVPDVREFPRRAWARAAKQVLRAASERDLGYGDVQGVERLRTGLAEYLARVRAVDAVPAQMIICAGVTQAIGLAVRALVASGIRHVAIEDPSHPDLRRLVAAAGARVVSVRVDQDGLEVGALARTPARAVIVTPAHQFPSGAVLSSARRRALVEWASACAGFVIEDDYDAEFRYDAPPVGAIQGLAPDRVIYTGSASKILAPGLRLGWMCVPPRLVDAAADAKRLADLGSPALDQLIYAEFVASGGLDSHLRRMRLLYRTRRDTLVRTLTASNRWTVDGTAAGLHLVATLLSGSDEQRLVDRARARGVGLYPMSLYWRDRRRARTPALVFGYAHLSNEAIERGLERALHRSPPFSASLSF